MKKMTTQLFLYVCSASALLCTSIAIAQDKPSAKGMSELEQAKRIAIAADRAERAAAPNESKKEPALSADESKVARFHKQANGGFIDRSKTRIVDQYRSADGVVIERITYGGKSYCVTSSTVNYVPGILHDPSSARGVTCPPRNAGWIRK